MKTLTEKLADRINMMLKETRQAMIDVQISKKNEEIDEKTKEIIMAGLGQARDGIILTFKLLKEVKKDG